MKQPSYFGEQKGSQIEPSEAARKLLFLATRNVTKQWSAPTREWKSILNQLAIRFEDRFPFGAGQAVYTLI